MRQNGSNTKKYRDAEVYEKKLARVMERFEVEEYDYD